MIAAWMLYCVAIAVLFVVVGEALERALHLAGRATRWAWVVALAGSYVVAVVRARRSGCCAHVGMGALLSGVAALARSCGAAVGSVATRVARRHRGRPGRARVGQRRSRRGRAVAAPRRPSRLGAPARRAGAAADAGA